MEPDERIGDRTTPGAGARWLLLIDQTGSQELIADYCSVMDRWEPTWWQKVRYLRTGSAAVILAVALVTARAVGVSWLGAAFLGVLAASVVVAAITAVASVRSARMFMREQLSRNRVWRPPFLDGPDAPSGVRQPAGPRPTRGSDGLRISTNGPVKRPRRP